MMMIMKQNQEWRLTQLRLWKEKRDPDEKRKNESEKGRLEKEINSVYEWEEWWE